MTNADHRTVRSRAGRPRRAARCLALLGVLVAASGIAAGDETAPPDAATLVARASAALEAKDPGAAWWHARQAVRADPAHAEAVALFEAMWRSLDAGGFVNAGRGPDEVVSDLGPPDERAAQRGAIRLAYGFMALEFADGRLAAVIDLRGLTVDAVRPRERLVPTHDDRDWTIGHRQVDRVQVNTEYVLAGETVQDWTELVTVQRMVGLAERGVPLATFADGMRDAFAAQAPKGTWRVLHTSDDEIVYEFIVPAGDAAPAQHELARLVRGRYDIHRVAYARKGAALPAAARDAWRQRLEAADLRAIIAARSAAQDDRP